MVPSLVQSLPPGSCARSGSVLAAATRAMSLMSLEYARFLLFQVGNAAKPRRAGAPMRLAGLIAAAAGYSQSELETTAGTRAALYLGP